LGFGRDIERGIERGPPRNNQHAPLDSEPVGNRERSLCLIRYKGRD